MEIPRSEGVSLRHSTQNRVDCKASWTQACEALPHTWTKATAAGRHCLSHRIRPKESVPVVTVRPARRIRRARAGPEVLETRVRLGRVEAREIVSGAAEKVR